MMSINGEVGEILGATVQFGAEKSEWRSAIVISSRSFDYNRAEKAWDLMRRTFLKGGMDATIWLESSKGSTRFHKCRKMRSMQKAISLDLSN